MAGDTTPSAKRTGVVCRRLNLKSRRGRETAFRDLCLHWLLTRPALQNLLSHVEKVLDGEVVAFVEAWDIVSGPLRRT